MRVLNHRNIPLFLGSAQLNVTAAMFLTIAGRRGTVRYRLLFSVRYKRPTVLIIVHAQANALCHIVQGYYSEEICSRRVSESGLKKVLLLREGATWHSFHAKRGGRYMRARRRLRRLSNSHKFNEPRGEIYGI